MIGREREVTNPGDYPVTRIEPWNTSVVVARDRQARLHPCTTCVRTAAGMHV